MLPTFLSHAQFQQRLRQELLNRYPDPAQSLLTWSEELRSVWWTDLDFLQPVLRRAYPDGGRPVLYQPVSLFRSLLLCHQRQFRTLTAWAKCRGSQRLTLVWSERLSREWSRRGPPAMPAARGRG